MTKAGNVRYRPIAVIGQISQHRIMRASTALLSPAIAVSLAACGPINYRGSGDDITARLMQSIPPGTSRQAFMAEAERRGWEVRGSWEGNRPDQYSDWGGIDGAHVVWVYLDGYYMPLRTDIDSFWAFDEKDRLKGVSVRKMIDAP